MKILSVLKTGLKDLMASYATIDPGFEYGNKSGAIFQNCAITFNVVDLRGLEIYIAKVLASSIDLTTPLSASLSEFVAMRPVLFSKKYPRVTETEEYKKFSIDAAKVKLINSEKLSSAECQASVDSHVLNFAGSISVSANITFTGSGITRILGIYPEQNLRRAAGTFVDTENVKFDNFLIGKFVDTFYDCMRNVFLSMDVFSAVTMKRRYFSVFETTSSTMFVSKFIGPYGEVMLQGSRNASLNEEITSLIDNSGCRTSYEIVKNLRVIAHVECSVQTLLILLMECDFVTYFTDIKDVIGTKLSPDTLKLPNILKASLDREDREEIISIIEEDRAMLLDAMKCNQSEIEEYDKKAGAARTGNKPVELINKLEYLNIVPLYARTYVTLNAPALCVGDIPSTNTETECLKDYLRKVVNSLTKKIDSVLEPK